MLVHKSTGKKKLKHSLLFLRSALIRKIYIYDHNKLCLGIGDIVLLVIGSGARKIDGNTDMPIDCAITAKVESFNIDPRYI